MTDFTRSDAEAMAAQLTFFADRSLQLRGAKARSRSELALDGLATALRHAPDLPTASEIGALLELLEEEMRREQQR